MVLEKENIYNNELQSDFSKKCITDAAGFSHITIYRNFKNKNEIVAYLIFGWCDEWYKRGMKNTPEEMAQYFKKLH